MLRTRTSYVFPFPAGRGDNQVRGQEWQVPFLASAGAGGLYDGLGAPGAGGEGLAGAVLGPDTRGGGSEGQVWRPPA